MRLFLLAVLSVAVLLTFTSCTSQEERIRQMNFGFREINLPMQLKNDELALKNDELRNDMAHHEGRRKDLTRIAVDTYMIEQDRAAIEVMNRFAQIWSYTIDYDTMKVTVGDTGDKALQSKFAELERRFDAANAECHKHADSSPYNYIVPKTVNQAEVRCASFREVYTAVMERNTATDKSSLPPSQHIFASAPAEVGGCASEIDEIPYSASVESTEHKGARQNKNQAQKRCDEILSEMKNESATCKNLAATTDESDADQTERFACLQEQKRLSTVGDTRYAELNAAVRRLNTTTQSEQK
jgi:hypothetical protein